ncbi:MAG: ParB/RepB/Spo0J family partition protein [Spirochaetia bacterium]|jgi:ParB/RepB/Spo0J family partition protein|nr:ParB/RepB/Spo0J family partition protein [Spirochaetia bacterium]
MGTQIDVEKIICDSDRKYGGQGNIEVLAESLRAIGLLQPVIVRDNGDASYTLIAGRRRLAAAKKLGWARIDARVWEADDERAREMALTENVNRQDLHPLDQADKFQGLLAAGKTIGDVAKYYDCSVSGIYQRVRLLDLGENLKAMFREDKITLTQAAMLAGLDAGQQEKFHAEHKNRKDRITSWEIRNFLHKVQKNTLARAMAGKDCAGCAQRTHHSNKTLFPELNDAEDVCFNGECYTRHWIRVFEKILKTEKQKFPDTKNILEISGIPKFWNRTGAIKLLNEDYQVRSFSYQNTANPKDKDSFMVWQFSGYGKIEIRRGCYKEAEKNKPGQKENDPLGIEHFLGKTEEEAEKILKNADRYKLSCLIKKEVLRLAAAAHKPKASGSWFTDLFFNRLSHGMDSLGMDIYQILTGTKWEKTFSEAKKKIRESPEEFFKLLFFMQTPFHRVPEPNDIRGHAKKDGIPFFGDCLLTLEEINGIYREATRKTVEPLPACAPGKRKRRNENPADA